MFSGEPLSDSDTPSDPMTNDLLSFLLWHDDATPPGSIPPQPGSAGNNCAQRIRLVPSLHNKRPPKNAKLLVCFWPHQFGQQTAGSDTLSSLPTISTDDMYDGRWVQIVAGWLKMSCL